MNTTFATELNAVTQYVSHVFLHNPNIPPQIFATIIPYGRDTLLVKLSQLSGHEISQSFENECKKLIQRKICSYLQYTVDKTRGSLQVQKASEYDVVRILSLQNQNSKDVAQNVSNTKILELKSTLYPIMSSTTGVHVFCALSMKPVTIASFCA